MSSDAEVDIPKSAAHASAEPAPPDPATAPEPRPSAAAAHGRTGIVLYPGNIWRIGFVVLGVAAVALILQFLIRDGGTVIFTVLMAWFASLAMEPAVRVLARHMKRGLATGLVIVSVVLFAVLFGAAFGQLMLEQVASLVKALPDLIQQAIDAFNRRAGTNYSVESILESLNITPSQAATYASGVLGGVLGLLGSVVGGFFSLFTFGLFTFYLAADGPRLRLWIASLFPPSRQKVAVDVWDVTADKTGGYVAARVVLAAINASTSAVVFALIGLPSWLALALWTGLVAQFVPTIGTYIAIVLPTLVGLLSDKPWTGIAALAWGVLYQQVENLTIEPRISARAVEVHPAVAFAAVMLGASLFGAAGAVLAVPVIAMLLSLLELYRTRYAVLPSLRPPERTVEPGQSP